MSIKRPVKVECMTADNGGQYVAIVPEKDWDYYTEIATLYDEDKGQEIAACINLMPRAVELLRAVVDVYEIGTNNGEAIDALLADWDEKVGS